MATIGTETGGHALPRLHWGAVIAGVLVALAVHVVLGLIGAAIGFAAVPAESGALGAGAAIWGIITPFVATLLGAWVAVRMAASFDGAGSNLHGIMVWCIGLIAGALFLTGTAATGAMSAGTAASGNAGTMQRMIGQSAGAARARTSAGASAAQAGKAAAAFAGGAAMAAIAGLLGAVAGAGIARSRRREGAGRGWHLPTRREHPRATREPGAYAGGAAREVEARDAGTRTYPPAEGIPPGGGTNEPPYQH